MLQGLPTSRSAGTSLIRLGANAPIHLLPQGEKGRPRYAIVGVFVAKDGNGVRVGVTGAGDNGVFRSADIEAALSKSFASSALEGLKIAPANLMGDIHASPEYRANLIAVMAKRAVAAAG